MKKLTRREFLKVLNRFLGFTGLAVIIIPIVRYFFPAKLEETPSEPVLIGTVDEIPEGSGKTVRFGRYPALVIHTSRGLKAYSAVCSHFACVVKWDPEINQIVCPCHDGFFDPNNGEVLAGPPPTALETYPVRVIDGEVFVGGEA